MHALTAARAGSSGARSGRDLNFLRVAPPATRAPVPELWNRAPGRGPVPAFRAEPNEPRRGAPDASRSGPLCAYSSPADLGSHRWAQHRKKKNFFFRLQTEGSCPFCAGGVPRSGAKITDRPDGSGLDWFGSPASCHGWQPPLRRKRGPRACRPFRGTFGTIRGRIPGNNQKDQCPRDDQKRPVCSINLVTTVQARS